MNAFQIVAGVWPPNPAPGTRPTDAPYHTTVASYGVYPRNQASVFSSVVPVFPATV